MENQIETFIYYEVQINNCKWKNLQKNIKKVILWKMKLKQWN